MHLNIFLFRRKFVFIKEWFCQSCYMHPKRGPHLPIHRTLSHEVSRSILGIRWQDFVRNSEVSLRTCLAPVSDRIIRYRNAIFGHVARLPVNTPAHQAMLRQVELSVGRPQTLHGNVHQVDHVVPNAAIITVFPLRLCGGSYWSRSLKSDATVWADYALTTTTTTTYDTIRDAILTCARKPT